MRLFFFLLTVVLFFQNAFSNASIAPKEPSYCIVYVHIGPSLPTFLKVAIDQALLFNNCPVYLILNQEALENTPKDFLKNVTPITCESLTKSKAHLSYIQKEQRNGFWKSTTERFFYLDDFLKQYNLKNVFHMENDVLLYADLSKILSIFEKSYPSMIGATFDSIQRCIAGFVYIAESRPLEELCNFIAYKAHLDGSYNCSDMHLINDFKKIYNKIYIDSLPIVPPAYYLDRELKSLLGETTLTPAFYSNNFETFNSLFDAAAIGQYLGGISPAHGAHKPGFINETCLFNPSYFSYVWEKDKKGRLIPFMIYKNIKYPISTLHIHSKNLMSFYSLRSKI